MIGYVCKYTPVELFAGFGEQAELILPEEGVAVGAHIHPNLCGYAKTVLQAAQGGGYSSVVLTDCCDALKRVADVLENAGVNVYTLSLPRAANAEAAALYANTLQRFIQTYEADSGKTFDMERFEAVLRQKGEDDTPTGKYIALMGARAPRWLAEACAKTCTLPIVDMTCARQPRLFDGELLDVKAERLAAGTESRASSFGNARHVGGFISAGDALAWYAQKLLAQTPCMRMWDVDARNALPVDENIAGILYHTVKFCDFYGFEYAGLRAGVPVLKLETNYEKAEQGQLSTNLQAFYENNGWLKKEQTGEKVGKTDGAAYYAGIDSGSTATKVVILGADRKIACALSLPTGAKSQESAKKAFEEALGQAGIGRGEVACIVSTGYGRHSLDWADKNVTEISCHAKGAHHLFPQAGTVIDIGGQDSKVIQLDEAGNVTDFTMNDKCAAGTGKFLEMMAHTLETDMDGMARLGREWKEDITITSMCAVFAESEVISLIAKNKEKADIIHGLHNSIAARVCAAAARQNAKGAFVMTGGVAKNAGVVREISLRVGEELLIPEQPQVCGALGAALFAAEI